MSRRFRHLVAIAVFAALAATAAGSAATTVPRITEAGGGVFPGRAYVLTLPRGMHLTPGAVTVTENGNPVSGLSVTPAASTTQEFATALVIDASTSMKGSPEQAAFAAAQAFAAQRKPNQQLGIVTYN